MDIVPTGNRSDFNYLDLSYPENSPLVNNTTNKVMTIADELNYLDLAVRSNFNSIDTDVYFAGKQFKKMTEIDLSKKNELLESEVLTSASKRIAAYNRESVRKLFDYKENGFEYCPVEGELLAEISKFNDTDWQQDSRILEASKAAFTKLAEEQGIDYDMVIPLGLIYRSEKPLGTALPAATLTHIDFDQNNTSEVMQSNKHGWKVRVEGALGKTLSDEEFENIKIEHMMNMWMPLENKPTENTLAMMDTSRIQSEDVQPFTAVIKPSPFLELKFTAMTLKPSNKQQYIIQSDMKLGDGVLFNTFDTPHSAVTVPRPEAEKDLPRRSIEIRAIFVKKQ